MKVKTVTLKNFQIHKKKRVFELDPNITVIVGPSDGGKSAIFRAIKLVSTNKPASPKIFCNSAKKDFHITIETDTHRIERTSRTYTLIDLKTKEEQIFKAFGTNVPEPIQQVFPLKLINWQRQIDPHFLIFQSGGIVSKTLEKALGNEDLRMLLETVKKDVSELKSEYKHHFENKRKYKQVMDSLEDTPDLLKKSIELKKQKDELNGLIEQKEELENTIDALQKINPIDHLKVQLDKQLKRIQEIICNYEKTLKRKEEANSLIDLISDLDRIALHILPDTIDKLINRGINKQINRINDLNEYKESYAQLTNLLNQMDSLDIEGKSREIEKDSMYYNKTLHELGICPMCSQKIKPNFSKKE